MEVFIQDILFNMISLVQIYFIFTFGRDRQLQEDPGFFLTRPCEEISSMGDQKE